MARRRHSGEQIPAKLRDADVMRADGLSVAKIPKRLETSEQTGHRRRNQYGGMRGPEVQSLKAMGKASAVLEQFGAEQAIDIRSTKDITEGKL